MSSSFTFHQVSYTATPKNTTLSISKHGRIGFTHQFVVSHGITNGMKACLYFDAASQTVGIAFTKESDPTAYPMGFTRGTGAYISALRFFDSIRVDPAKYAGRYEYEQRSGSDIGVPEASTVFLLTVTDQTATPGGSHLGSDA